MITSVLIVIQVKQLTRTSKNLWCRLDMSRMLVYIKFDVSPRICITSLFWFYQANIGFVACGSTSPGIYQWIPCTIIIAVQSRLQIWFNSIYPLGFLSLTIFIYYFYYYFITFQADFVFFWFAGLHPQTYLNEHDAPYLSLFYGDSWVVFYSIHFLDLYR